MFPAIRTLPSLVRDKIFHDQKQYYTHACSFLVPRDGCWVSKGRREEVKGLNKCGRHLRDLGQNIKISRCHRPAMNFFIIALR